MDYAKFSGKGKAIEKWLDGAKCTSLVRFSVALLYDRHTFHVRGRMKLQPLRKV